MGSSQQRKMTIQEYKEKIVHTIEQMELEHNIDLEMFNLQCEERVYSQYSERPMKKWFFKMLVK